MWQNQQCSWWLAAGVRSLNRRRLWGKEEKHQPQLTTLKRTIQKQEVTSWRPAPSYWSWKRKYQRLSSLFKICQRKRGNKKTWEMKWIHSTPVYYKLGQKSITCRHRSRSWSRDLKRYQGWVRQLARGNYCWSGQKEILLWNRNPVVGGQKSWSGCQNSEISYKTRM